MRQRWDDFRLALSFLTLLPVGRDIQATPEMLGRSMGLFPAVGLLLGLGLCLINGVLQGLLPRAVLDCLLILLLIIATGALHLDGVADLFDGLAGGKNRASILEIMKDSRVGAIGVVGLVMVLLLKYLSLFQVPLEYKNAALILMPTAGRWMQVCLCRYAPYVRTGGGTGQAFVENVGSEEFWTASVTLVVAALLLFGVKGIVPLISVAVAAMLSLRYFNRRLGGITGDVLGAMTEMVEVLMLLVVLATFTG